MQICPRGKDLSIGKPLQNRRWPNSHLATPFIGTHFSRLCSPIHGSDRVSPDSGDSRSMPFDMDSRKPGFISSAPWPASLSLGGPSPQALTSEGLGLLDAPFWGMPTEPEAFWGLQGVSGLRPSPGPTLKKGRLVGHSINTDSTRTLSRTYR